MTNTKFIDLTGQKIGRLTVLSKAESRRTPSGQYVTMWNCKCDCGKFVKVRGSQLRSAKTLSCGCLKREVTSKRMSKDLKGKRFGRLIVLFKCGKRRGSIEWECLCDCGNRCKVTTRELCTGDTKSCGCIRKERNNNTKHSKSHSRIYHIWVEMKQRCYNSNTRSYEYYGGRGITVCAEWINDFEIFYKWAITNGYTDDLTIERIDVNGNYCPENCTWITLKEQSKNKRTTHKITFKGKTQTIREWAEELDVPYGRIQSRLHAGWSIEEALTIPKQDRAFKKVH